jgi:hypothetical protein
MNISMIFGGLVNEISTETSTPDFGTDRLCGKQRTKQAIFVSGHAGYHKFDFWEKKLRPPSLPIGRVSNESHVSAKSSPPRFKDRRWFPTDNTSFSLPFLIMKLSSLAFAVAIASGTAASHLALVKRTDIRRTLYVSFYFVVVFWNRLADCRHRFLKAKT